MKYYTGINIQSPISQKILSGEKTVETRTYPIPSKYLGKKMLLIETPGKTGKFKARIVAVIRFKNCFQYKTKKDFYLDEYRHFVTRDSIWSWKGKAKWGWEVELIRRVVPPIELEKRKGIIFTLNIKL